MSLAVAGFLLAAGCSGGDGDGRRTIVASIYPLAFVAERLTGPEWEVIDLTPPGVEAHDLELSLEQRAAIQEADLVLYLGDIGFQPQVERAVDDASGLLVETGSFSIEEGNYDPHFWVVPTGIDHILFDLTLALGQIDSDEQWLELSLPLRTEARRMHAMYHKSLEVADCQFRTIIVTHEAFDVLSLYDIEQFGLSGLTPEAEPTAERLAQARELIDGGQAGAVFYEEHEEARQLAESFAADAGVPALPLSTLESRPAEGDYFTVMEDNLESLREGLGCR